MKKENMYTGHKPRTFVVGELIHYEKIETDDHFLFNKDMSISINATMLELVDIIIVVLKHRDVTLRVTQKAVKEHRKVRRFFGETKFYYPIDQWDIVSGDVNWAEKLKKDKINGKLLLPDVAGRKPDDRK